MDTKITNTDDKIEITIVWPDRPAEIDHKILAYWDKNSITPLAGRSHSQLQTIIAVAEKNGEIIAVMGGRQESQFRSDINVMFLHSSVAPEFRGQRLPRNLLEETDSFLCRWSKNNPDRRLMGTAYFFESARYAHRNRPIRPNGAVLSSFTKKGNPFSSNGLPTPHSSHSRANRRGYFNASSQQKRLTVGDGFS